MRTCRFTDKPLDECRCTTCCTRREIEYAEDQLVLKVLDDVINNDFLDALDEAQGRGACLSRNGAGRRKSPEMTSDFEGEYCTDS